MFCAIFKIILLAEQEMDAEKCFLTTFSVYAEGA